MSSRIIISLPIADRRRSHDFYRAALGLRAVGPVADDGVPEPLVFELGQDASLMLVPTGGFGWVIGDHEVAPRGTSECLLSVDVEDPPAVDAAVERARTAGAAITAEAGQQPWGYAATFADPDGHLWSISCATPAADEG